MDWQAIIESLFRGLIGERFIVFALAAIGLNLHFGYTGLLNFGVAGFMTVGAYGLGVSVAYYGWPWPVGVLVGILASVAFALLLGFPTLRLRADYLAIVTIAAAEIVRIAMRATALRDITGGSNGINGFSSGFYDLNPFSDGVSLNLGLFNLDFRADQLWILSVGWTLVLLAVLFTWLTMRSQWGRVVKSVREDEDAARSLGKN